jgi:hypothetical protein
VGSVSGAGPARAVRVGATSHTQRGGQDHRPAGARRAASCLGARNVMRVLRPTGRVG